MHILSLAVLFLITVIPAATRAQMAEPPPAPVVVTKVIERAVRQPVTLIGTVEPSRRSTVASEVPGLVRRLIAQEGDYVKKGRVMAEFQTELLRIRLREAVAMQTEAEARFELASKDFARFTELKDKGVASLRQVQDTEAELKAWEAKIAQAAAGVDRLEYDIRKSAIRAPFSGYITREYTEVGQWVEEGGPIVEIQDLDPVEIVVDMPERYITMLTGDDAVLARLDALPGSTLEGTVGSIVPEADRASRNFAVKVVVKNTDMMLKTGMLARVDFSLGRENTVMLVPKDAIVDDGGMKMVFVVNDGIVAPVPVSVGLAFGDMVRITGEITPGMDVVIRGNERLRPGQKVGIVNTAAPGAKKL